MAEPIVFISRNRVKAGRLDDWRAFVAAGSVVLERDKPRTQAFLVYLGDDEREVTIIHAFADADAFDRHVEGADDRSKVAYELIDPVGFEIYGRPSDATLDGFRLAAAAGLGLAFHPELSAGFLRAAETEPPQ